MDGPAIDPVTAAQLVEAFGRNGYVRRQDSECAAELGSKSYKKGDEIRFVVRDETELEPLRALLVQAGFKPGKPYAQGSGWRQPVYGRKQVAAFLEMAGTVEAGI